MYGLRDADIEEGVVWGSLDSVDEREQRLLLHPNNNNNDKLKKP